MEGIKIAGYVRCQTNVPFDIAGESVGSPVYLDKLVDTLRGESIPTCEKKVQCCVGALAISEPEKDQEMVKGIIEAAYDQDVAGWISGPLSLQHVLNLRGARCNEEGEECSRSGSRTI
jgi:heterodisulfide reductase subunit B